MKNEKIKKLLSEPICNMCHAFADDFSKANADQRQKMGIKSQIIRTVTGNCCEWCKQMAGAHDYNSTDNTFFRRHAHCKCTIEIKSQKTRQEGQIKISNVAKYARLGIIEGEKIIKSVGAKSINEYNVTNPLTGEPIEFIVGRKILYPKDSIIAGVGSKKRIRMIDILIDAYGGTPEEWTHKKGYFEAYDEYGEEAFVELHWYAMKDGIKHRITPIVRDGEVFFYDIEAWEASWKW